MEERFASNEILHVVRGTRCYNLAGTVAARKGAIINMYFYYLILVCSLLTIFLEGISVSWGETLLLLFFLHLGRHYLLEILYKITSSKMYNI